MVTPVNSMPRNTLPAAHAGTTSGKPSGAQATQQTQASAEPSAGETAIRDKLTGMFSHLMVGDNQSAFHQLIADRAKALHAMQETPETVEATLASHAHSPALKADRETLEPVMQQALDKQHPQEKPAKGHDFTALKTHAAMQLVRMGATAVVTSRMGVQAGAKMNTLLETGGNAFAERFIASREKAKAQQSPAEQSHAAFLFGRTDWKTQFSALKSETAAPEQKPAPAAHRSPRDAISDALTSKRFTAASVSAMTQLADVALNAASDGPMSQEKVVQAVADKVGKSLQEGIPKAAQWGADQMKARLAAGTQSPAPLDNKSG